MKEHNEIDALFESAFDGLTLTPDSSVKENIDQAIASKKKRRRFLFILFPVLFGTIGFAALLYVSGPIPGKIGINKSIAQKNKPAKHPSAFHSNTQSNTYEKIKHPKNGFASSAFETPTNSIGKTAANTTQISFSTVDKQNTLPIISSQPQQIQITSESKTPEDLLTSDLAGKEENRLREEKETDSISENNPDSTLEASSRDSAYTVISDTQQLVKTANKSRNKWSVSVLGYWEGEKKRGTDFTNHVFVNQKNENARIHSSTFYGKIEINRKFQRRWEVLTGIGFRSSRIVQYGYLSKIVLPIPDLSSGVPMLGTPAPDTVRSTEIQSFQVNSIIVPLGIAYNQPLGRRVRIRISGGLEFAYGQFAKRNLQPDLSTPDFNPFGCSAWIRPEFYYTFNRFELFGFGTFNQAISQQLKWNFEPKRNAAFGTGIGIRFFL